MRRAAQVFIGRDAITALLCFLLSTSLAIAATNVSYDIVYVRLPRFGDNTNTIWVNSPTRRHKDKTDAIELIKAHNLPRDLPIVPPVRHLYTETWDALQANT